ncbi:uncharacterized protein FIESC28_09096 [Fusarium coffeatum]|uniref:Amine oxidase n=1 Tax=Fusarium coffeatum TaxID=231269 RepID=A0A366R2N5_9HYPO|nr:uncharacterized protein FIESC28_09096 [Fusarium coffeatum]RBR11212.1 hypothetical protein FIESC28_09096 [Fusarium coffeatum]
MRSHNTLLRGVLTLVAVASCFIIVLAVFHIKIADSLSIIPVQERPFFYEQQPHQASPTQNASPEEDDAEAYLEQDDKSSAHHDYRLLTSLRNNMGFYNKIDAKLTGHQIMNPTLLELPRNANSSHHFLIIARAPHVIKKIGDKRYKLARQVATFGNLTYNNLGRPLLKTGKWSRLLVNDFGGPEHHCQRQPDMDRYIGPEDMKLFWTRTGEPLLIFTHQVDDEVMCQGQFIIDVRAAMPELEQALGAETAALLPPIRFAEPTSLHREAPEGEENHPRYQREKNWALAQSPFTSDQELLLMVEPGQLYRYTSAEDPVELVVSEKDQISIVQEPYPPTADKTWHSKLSKTCMHDVMLDERHVHQSSPMLSVTLCNRGTCEPNEQNTIMMGIVQRRQDPPNAPFTWYDRRVAVYESAPPYRMISVSKKLTYHGESDGRYVWTGSMSYYTNQTVFPPSNHGFLDDEVWLGFGIKDAAAGWLDVRARDLVADHYLCQGASAEYKHYRQGLSA